MSLEPFAMGVCVCLALNALALLAALAVAVRAEPAGRAELGVAVTMVWSFLVMVPVYGLGLTNHLTPRPLAMSSAVFFGAVYAIARWRTPRFGRRVARAAWGLLRMPFDAVIVSLRAKSLAAVAVGCAIAMVTWTLFCAYYTPSWRQWDALWYHEPIVAFTIQNHGFAFVDLPQGGAQKINGYPRLCEMTQLWFVIFTDRRVIDMVSHVVAPSLMLSVYLLARRNATQTVAMACACALVAMPACAMLLGSEYVDVHNAAFILAGAHFATRPTLRLRDAALAAISLALAIGSKHMAIVPVGVLGLITAARAIAGARGRRLKALGAVIAGTAVIVGTASTTYLRNWIQFKNPFWPDLKYDNETLGIHWPGSVEWKMGDYDAGVNRIDMNVPFDTLLEDLYRIPYSVHRGYYTQAYEYGLAVTCVVVPITFFVVFALALTPFRDLVARIFRRPAWRASAETRNASLLAITLLPILYFSPALWGARYQVAAVGIALGLVAWAGGQVRAPRLGEALAGAMTVLAIVSFFWTQPRWWLWWSEAKLLASVPYPEREFVPASALGVDLSLNSGSPITREAGIAREKQLGPGAVLAFFGSYSNYMALFWNNDYSNKAVWIADGPDWLDRLRASNAMWVYAAYGDPRYKALHEADSGFVEIAPLQVEHWGAVFRRVRW